MDSESDYVTAFLEIFTEAVKCRLRNLPIGVMISGGLDSSSVIARQKRFFVITNPKTLYIRFSSYF